MSIMEHMLDSKFCSLTLCTLQVFRIYFLYHTQIWIISTEYGLFLKKIEVKKTVIILWYAKRKSEGNLLVICCPSFRSNFPNV